MKLTLYCNVLHDKRALILLDNAADAVQVKPLIPPPTCALLVTSRRRFALPGFRAIPLDVMPPTDARDLLVKIAPRINEHADTIAKLCGYLPLALRVAASTLAVHEDLALAKFIERLQAQRLKMLKSEDDPEGDVEAVLGTSYAMIAPEMQARWRALSVFPAAFDAPAAASVWAIALDSAQDLLSDLVRLSLLNYATEDEGRKTKADIRPWSSVLGRYFLHDLLRDYANARLNDDERNAAQLRHAQHYLQVARTADELYLLGGDHVLKGLALFDAEWQNIRLGQAWASANWETNEDAARLCDQYPSAGQYCLEFRLHAREQIEWFQDAANATRKLGNKLSEGRHLCRLGIAYHSLGEIRSAIQQFEQYLSIARNFKQRADETIALGNLGNAYAVLHDSHKAIEFYGQALAIARDLGDKRSEGSIVGARGSVYFALGDAGMAIEFYEQALSIARDIGDRNLEGSLLVQVGFHYISNDLGDRVAESKFKEAARIFAAIGNKHGMIGATIGLAGLAYVQHEDAQARKLYREAALIAEEIGARGYVAAIKLLRSPLEGETLNLETAINLASEARQAFAEIGIQGIDTMMQPFLQMLQRGQFPE